MSLLDVSAIYNNFYRNFDVVFLAIEIDLITNLYLVEHSLLLVKITSDVLQNGNFPTFSCLQNLLHVFNYLQASKQIWS